MNFTQQTAPKSSNLKKWLLVVVGVVVVAAIAFTAVSLISGANNSGKKEGSNSQDHTASVDGYSIKYPASWHELNIGQEDEAQGVVLKLSKRDPQASLVWRTLAGEVDKNVKVDDLPNQVAASLKKELPEFALLGSRTTKIGELTAAEIHYQHKGVDDKKKDTFENKMYVIPQKENTYYLTLSAKKGDLAKVEAEASQILDSIQGYIVSHP